MKDILQKIQAPAQAACVLTSIRTSVLIPIGNLRSRPEERPVTLVEFSDYRPFCAQSASLRTAARSLPERFLGSS